MSCPEQIQTSHPIDIGDGGSHTEITNRSTPPIVKKIIRVSVVVCFVSVFNNYLIIVPIIVAVLLTPALLVIRLLQFTKRGHGFNHVIQLKFLIRSWICITTLSIIILSYIGVPVPLPDPPISGVVMDPMSTLIIAIYFVSCALPAIVHRLLPRIQLDHNEGGIKVPEAVSEMINCVIFWLLESKLIIVVFPFHSETLGVPNWRWIEKVLFAIIGYNGIRLCIYGIVWLVKKACRALDPGPCANPHWYLLAVDNLLPRKHVVYFANGMKSSTIFILTSMMLLLIWVQYYGKHLDKTEQAERVLEIGTWTFSCLLFCSLLWSIKTCVLLAWEAQAIYERLDSQILEARKHLYFLGLLGRHKFDIFHLLYQDNAPKNIFLKFCRKCFEVATPDIKYRSRNDKEDRWGVGEVSRDSVKKIRLLTRKKKAVKDDLLMPNGRTPTTYDIKEITQYLQAAKDALSNKNYASDILCHLKSNNPSGDDHGVRVEHLKQLIIVGNNWKDAVQDSNDQPSSEENGNNVQPSAEETEHDVQHASEGTIEQTQNNIIQLSSEGSDNNVHPSSEGIVEQTENHFRPSSSEGVVEEAENNAQPSSEEIKNNDWNCFEEMLNDVNLITTSNISSAPHDDSRGSDVPNINHDPTASLEEMISFEKIRIWTEMARKRCLYLANAVNSGMELVDLLNTIISGVIIGVTFIIWLLLTKLATTKVLVVIGSPIVAASFIFGDTCKNLFHSIIFVYVLHPFDVGDICDIHEDSKVEVKSIGVWKTTFSKTDEAGNQVEVIYPNSELANKKVINYKTKFSLHCRIARSISTASRVIEQTPSMANINST